MAAQQKTHKQDGLQTKNGMIFLTPTSHLLLPLLLPPHSPILITPPQNPPKNKYKNKDKKSTSGLSVKTYSIKRHHPQNVTSSVLHPKNVHRFLLLKGRSTRTLKRPTQILNSCAVIVQNILKLIMLTISMRGDMLVDSISAQ